MERKDLFKTRRVPFLAESLAKRCQNIIAERQEKRREFFWGSVVSDVSSPINEQLIEKKKNSRAEMLQKWKAEKMRKIEEAKKKQKPIFKVGIVQRKVTGSPVFTQSKTNARNNVANKLCYVKTQRSDSDEKKAGVLTRAKARNLNLKSKQIAIVNSITVSNKEFNNKFYKIDNNKKKEVNSLTFNVPKAVSKLTCGNLTFPYSPRLTRKSIKSVVSVESKNKLKAVKLVEPLEKVLSKENSMKGNRVKSPAAIPEKVNPEQDHCTVKSELESSLRTPEIPSTEQDYFRPIYYSPYVTVRSGKKSKRKSKRKLVMDVEEQIKKEENEFSCRIFSFRKYIECETRRLLEMCDEWKHIYEEFEEVPTDVEGDIDSAIGKTKLLTSDKFNQFRSLVDKCENGDPFVKIDDLQGFQDWISITVERIDEEFHKLKERKCNNWQVKAPSTVVTVRQTKAVKNPIKKVVGKSNIRSHILAARKLLKGDASDGKNPQVPILALDEVKKSESMKKDNCLLKEVLNSETKLKKQSSAKKSSTIRESRNSGLEIMIATQKNKFSTPLKKSPLLNDFEVFIGKEDTPNRSILKKTPKTFNSSKGHVTFKKLTENMDNKRGLSDKYFQPLMDDENSPMRTVLGDLGNLTTGGMKTRSKARESSRSVSKSPQVK